MESTKEGKYLRDTLMSIFSTSNFGTVQNVDTLNPNAWLVTSSTGEYVLKKKNDLDKVRRERTVLDYLRGNNVAAHSMLAEYQAEDGQIYCLYSYAVGQASISSFSYVYSGEMGRAIGQLHNALKTFQGTCEFAVKDIYNSTFSTVLDLIKTSDNPSIACLATLLGELKEEMHVLTRLPKQLIHRDAHGDNMIFKDGHSQGFIDFDLLEINIRLFDPCYAAMGVLPNRFQEKGFEQEWIKFLGGILTGYNRVTPLTLHEIRSIWFVIFAIEALFVAVFTKSSPQIAEKNAQICLWLHEIRCDVQQLEMEIELGLLN